MANLQLLINAAMRDSNHDLSIKRLGDRAQESASIETLQKILPVFLYRLSGASAPPMNSDLSDILTNDQVYTAYLSLDALSRAVSANQESLEDTAIHTRICSKWPLIWGWLSFFVFQIISRNGRPTQSSTEDLVARNSLFYDLEYTSSSLLSSLLLVSEISKEMLKTKGLVRLVTDFRLVDRKLRKGTLHHLNAFFLTLQRPQHDWSMWQQECLAVLDVRPKETASALLGAIMRAVAVISPTRKEDGDKHPDDVGYDKTSLSSNLLMTLHFSTLSSKLNMEFTKSGSVKWMACLFRRLVKTPVPIPDLCSSQDFNSIHGSFETVVGFMKGTLSYLITCIKFHGYISVVQALQNRILESIVSARSWIVEDEQRPLTVSGDQHLSNQSVELLQLIAGYTSYLPVLKVLETRLPRAEKIGMIKRNFRSLFTNSEDEEIEIVSELEEAWGVLASITKLRLEDRRRWNRVGFNLCENRECPESREGYFRRMLRCTGCGISIYCSTACQRIMWKSGHRETCHQIQENFQALDLDARQESFCVFQMKADVEKYRRIPSEQNHLFFDFNDGRRPWNLEPNPRTFPNGNDQDVLRIDYRSVPIKLSCSTVDQCRLEEDAATVHQRNGHSSGTWSKLPLATSNKDCWDYWDQWLMRRPRPTVDGDPSLAREADGEDPDQRRKRLHHWADENGTLMYAIFPHGQSKKFTFVEFLPFDTEVAQEELELSD
ncbi:hypothetical protein L218DRAFT_674061 [Marasmius fiardii PR-910]|nr:hypothetical protein L218DRAFT_674061 [Marasmius fiardii PR-910]